MGANLETTIGEIVAQMPAAARIFSNHQIDFCCGGKRPLNEVCREKRMDAETMLKEIEAAHARTPFSDTDWNSAPLPELTAYIVKKHHGYLRSELPWLETMVRKVAGKHGENHAFLPALQDTFLALRQELESHLQKEEMILFPYINALAGGTQAPSCFGTVANPIRVMEAEHEGAGEALRTLRSLTSEYTLPPDVCMSFRILYAGLAALESDLHQHIHLENNILHKRALALEAATVAA